MLRVAKIRMTEMRNVSESSGRNGASGTKRRVRGGAESDFHGRPTGVSAGKL